MTYKKELYEKIELLERSLSEYENLEIFVNVDCNQQYIHSTTSNPMKFFTIASHIGFNNNVANFRIKTVKSD